MILVWSDCIGSKVTALLKDNTLIDRVSDGEEFQLITDRTCFYAERGGQAADIGHVANKVSVFLVRNSHCYCYLSHGHATKCSVSNSKEYNINYMVLLGYRIFLFIESVYLR